jgi:predicted DCC family thiol-disulfide oxidoreductase YuxK
MISSGGASSIGRSSRVPRSRGRTLAGIPQSSSGASVGGGATRLDAEGLGAGRLDRSGEPIDGNSARPAGATPTTTGDSAIVLYDGACRFCNAWVDFLLARDRAGRFQFAGLDSEAARDLMRRYGLDPEQRASLVLIADGRAYLRSDAALRILVLLGGAWRVAGGVRIIPRSVRDAAYNSIARHRYRWFGRRRACRRPSADQAGRFLD